MLVIYFIIFLISIDGIISADRLLIIASCQIELIPRPSNQHYFFYFSNSSSSSLSPSSSSSSFLPLLHLSYCEHQQTTSYSSSGFSILYSSPRLPLTDIEDKKHSSSFHHNAVLSAIDQSSSPTSNIITLMSSSNQNQILVDKNDNLISTTTAMSGFSNLSLLTTSLLTEIQKGNPISNSMLLIGCMITGILILIIICVIIKYCNRDEGTYKIDESNNFLTKSSVNNSENNGCTGKMSSSTHHRQKLLPTNEQKLANSKEWYV